MRRSTDGRMKKGPGRPATVQGTYDDIHDYLRDRKLGQYFRVEMRGKKVIVTANESNRKWEEKIDGVLVVETTDRAMSPSEIVAHYKQLQDVERGFRTLKSSLDLRPMYHWTIGRIKALVFVCVIALQTSRVMRKMLSGSKWSWERALGSLRGIKTFVVKAGEGQRRGITCANDEQRKVLRQLELPFPSQKHIEKMEQV
ncbi:MAG: transposase [bacterium]